MDQIAFAIQNSVHRIGDISANLTHPQSIRAGCDASDLHFPRRQINEEQDEEGEQPQQDVNRRVCVFHRLRP